MAGLDFEDGNMAIVVIGGHSRSVGKTSVVAGLIAALPQFGWTALKITQYGHGICCAQGRACHCASVDHKWAITEERNRSGGSDTSRFLLAGARSALWVRTEQGRLGEAIPSLLSRLSDKAYIISESNSLLKFLRPDMYLTVLNPEIADFKVSARQFLPLADALIVHKIAGSRPAWNNISFAPVLGKPIFRISPPSYVTSEIIDFVSTRLAGLSSPLPA